jgi:H+/Cl- antiporter ClcA
MAGNRNIDRHYCRGWINIVFSAIEWTTCVFTWSRGWLFASITRRRMANDFYPDYKNVDIPSCLRISGYIVFKWAPEAEGHGTGAAINSFHNKDGLIRRRIPLRSPLVQ